MPNTSFSNSTKVCQSQKYSDIAERTECDNYILFTVFRVQKGYHQTIIPA